MCLERKWNNAGNHRRHTNIHFGRLLHTLKFAAMQHIRFQPATPIWLKITTTQQMEHSRCIQLYQAPTTRLAIAFIFVLFPCLVGFNSFFCVCRNLFIYYIPIFSYFLVSHIIKWKFFFWTQHILPFVHVYSFVHTIYSECGCVCACVRALLIQCKLRRFVHSPGTFTAAILKYSSHYESGRNCISIWMHFEIFMKYHK